MDPIRGYFYPAFQPNYERNSAITDTIILIALSIFPLAVANAIDYEAPGLALLLRFVPLGFSLFWLFNRAQGRGDGPVVVEAHYSPPPVVLVQPVPPPQRHYNPFNWLAQQIYRPTVAVEIPYRAPPAQPLVYGNVQAPRNVFVQGSPQLPPVRANFTVQPPPDSPPRSVRPNFTFQPPGSPPPSVRANFTVQPPAGYTAPGLSQGQHHHVQPRSADVPLYPSLNQGLNHGAQTYNQHAANPGNQRPIFAHGDAAPAMNPNRGAQTYNQHASHSGNQRPITPHGNVAPAMSAMLNPALQMRAPTFNQHASHAGNQRAIFAHQ